MSNSKTNLKSIEVSFVRKPLIVVRFVGATTDGEFREYLALLERNLEDSLGRGTTTAVAIDASDQPNAISAAQRRIQADWIRAHYQSLATACVGTAFVAPTAILRGIITAVFWMQRLPYPYAVVGTLSEAEAWCAGQLAASPRSMAPPRRTGGT